MNNEQVAEQDEAEELDAAFFENAILTRPGESVMETVSRASWAPTNPHDDNGN